MQRTRLFAHELLHPVQDVLKTSNAIDENKVSTGQQFSVEVSSGTEASANALRSSLFVFPYAGCHPSSWCGSMIR